MRLDFNAIKFIFPDKVRSMKDLNQDLEVPLTARQMILKAMAMLSDSTASDILEITGLTDSTLTKIVAKLIKENVITKELRSSKPHQSGNGKRAYFNLIEANHVNT